MKGIYEISRRRYRWQQKVLNVFSGFPISRCLIARADLPGARALAPKRAGRGTRSRSPPGRCFGLTPDQPPGLRDGKIMIELEFFAQMR
jgi:hypothetical protein